MLTIKDAASSVGRTGESVRRWIRSGQLLAERDGMSGIYAIDELEFARFCKEHSIRRSDASDSRNTSGGEGGAL